MIRFGYRTRFPSHNSTRLNIYMLHGCTITCIDRKKQLQSCSWLFGALMFIHSQPKKNTTNSAAKYGTKSDSFVSAIEMCVCVLCAVHVCQKRAHWRTNEAVRAERLWHKTLSKERYTRSRSRTPKSMNCLRSGHYIHMFACCFHPSAVCFISKCSECLHKLLASLCKASLFVVVVVVSVNIIWN